MESKILEQVVVIKKTNKKYATHFALCKGDKIRYLIDFSGKKQLSKNISTYSGKLGLLIKLLPVIPFSALKIGKMGYYVDCSLTPIVKDAVEKYEKNGWNMIVGTYGIQQKIVLQCFKKNEPSVFLKIGNDHTSREMKNETEFLKQSGEYKSFKVPKLVDSFVNDDQLISQATIEFCGNKVKPTLNESIISIYREISSIKSDGDKEFSHGDFAPWNMKFDDQYIIFDWEFCGMRIKGFDLMHFVTVTRILLEGMDFDRAFENGLSEVKKFIPDFEINKEEFQSEFQALH